MVFLRLQCWLQGASPPRWRQLLVLSLTCAPHLYTSPSRAEGTSAVHNECPALTANDVAELEARSISAYLVRGALMPNLSVSCDDATITISFPNSNLHSLAHPRRHGRLVEQFLEVLAEALSRSVGAVDTPKPEATLPSTVTAGTESVLPQLDGATLDISQEPIPPTTPAEASAQVDQNPEASTIDAVTRSETPSPSTQSADEPADRPKSAPSSLALTSRSSPYRPRLPPRAFRSQVWMQALDVEPMLALWGTELPGGLGARIGWHTKRTRLGMGAHAAAVVALDARQGLRPFEVMVDISALLFPLKSIRVEPGLLLSLVGVPASDEFTSSFGASLRPGARLGISAHYPTGFGSWFVGGSLRAVVAERQVLVDEEVVETVPWFAGALSAGAAFDL